MPIYEYESVDSENTCEKCASRFEVIQALGEAPLTVCPECGGGIRKVISWCRAAVVETSPEHARVEQQIREYEKQGMWSHAAELADTHSEKIKDRDLKMRALDDYEKAGYKAETLEKHISKDDE